MRVAAYFGSPSTVVYGLAIVSRNVRPLAITHTPKQERPERRDDWWLAG